MANIFLFFPEELLNFYCIYFTKNKKSYSKSRDSSAAGGRGPAAGGTSIGSSTLVQDRSSTPVATEYADDVAGEALGADDDASETDEPSAPPAAPPENVQHDDAMGDR